jgi:hypothetical protein
VAPSTSTLNRTSGKEEVIVWDTVQTNDTHLSHDMPCVRCGHAAHTFLACGDGCDCQPALMPGDQHLVNA